MWWKENLSIPKGHVFLKFINVYSIHLNGKEKCCYFLIYASLSALFFSSTNSSMTSIPHPISCTSLSLSFSVLLPAFPHFFLCLLPLLFLSLPPIYTQSTSVRSVMNVILKSMHSWISHPFYTIMSYFSVVVVANT